MKIVVKCGSALLSHSDGRLNKEALRRIASQLISLHSLGHEIVLVSSGAVAAGMGRFNLQKRPTDLREKQAAAAVGQVALMEAYEEIFSEAKILPAQVLLTREDLMDRKRYLNVRNTMLHLLSLRVIPIVNENDTVSTDEIQFGDNDALSAIVATKLSADKLILLSDVQGLFRFNDAGERTDELWPVVDRISTDLLKNASKVTGSKFSVGGIYTKLKAAQMATAGGVETWLASGTENQILQKILADETVGTKFLPSSKKVATRHAWIAFGRSVKGSIRIDDGAADALQSKRRSLLPKGIVRVQGQFSEGDTVGIRLRDGEEIGRGLINFSSDELSKIKGRHSNEVAAVLGRSTATEVIHRDNLVLF